MDQETRVSTRQTSVSMTIADYVNVDAAGKANLVGAGIRVLTCTPARTDSAPFAVWAAVSLTEAPSRSVVVELVLAGKDGSSVRLADATGALNEIRITQSVPFDAHLPLDVDIPLGQLPLTHVLAANFTTGLRFAPDTVYRWQVESDGVVVGTYPFYVIGG